MSSSTDASGAAQDPSAPLDSSATASSEHKSTHRFEAEVNQLLHLVIHSLYSNKEIFLRELLSNASDALDKLRFRALTEPELRVGDEPLRIRIVPDKERSTLTIWDNGIGMTAEEMVKQLGTVAHSGTKAFLEQMQQDKGADLQLIGQFGVGFYSAYLVADTVEVLSLAAGDRQAHRWVSDAKESFSIEPTTRVTPGTSVVLHLRADQREYLEPARLRHLVKQYSDYLAYPIEMATEPDSSASDETSAATAAATASTFERVNQGTALWQQNPDRVSTEEYDAFYRHLTHDAQAPLARRHFKVEGTQEFVALLFVPRQAPFDLFLPEAQHGVRLHVRRVMVMEQSAELLPKWLRFLRGVVDSEDLPLNVSRELLQDSAAARVIRKQLLKHGLDMLDEVASAHPGDYAAFWAQFGAVLKEGLHFDPTQRERLIKLLRYESSRGEGLVSLADYKERMPEAQQAIYYALGDSAEALSRSPHLEGLKARGFEVLWMTHPVDPWAVEGLGDFEGLPLVDAAQADLKLEQATASTDEQAKQSESKDDAPAFQALFERMRLRLQDHISEVRSSDRLTESPACLVTPPGGLSAHTERMLRAAHQGMPKSKRVLEVNINHPLLSGLRALLDGNQADDRFGEWVDLLYQQALLAEGSAVDNPVQLAHQLAQLLTRAAQQEAAALASPKPA